MSSQLSNQSTKAMTFKQRLGIIGKDLYVLVMLLALMWIVAIIDIFYGHRISYMFGIRPYSVQGLLGIFFAPFLHASIQHITANTICFLVLGSLVMVRGRFDFFWVSFCSMVGSGLGTWFLASPSSMHIGASGLIFGYLGFLIAIGYFERSVVSVSISIFVCVVYGGLLWGILPLNKGISWQMHFLGFISGLWSATTLHKLIKRRA